MQSLGAGELRTFEEVGEGVTRYQRFGAELREGQRLRINFRAGCSGFSRSDSEPRATHDTVALFVGPSAPLPSELGALEVTTFVPHP